MKDNLKNKILKLFVVILMILSTLLACSVLAEELEENIQENEEEKFGEIIIRSEHTRNYENGSYIPLEHLNDYYDVFCRQHGTALPNMAQTTFVANGVTYEFPYLTTNDIGMRIGEITTSGRSPYERSYTHKTIGRYRIESTNRATPEEAYILSEMIKVDGLGEYNYAQIAWWNTEVGSTGNSYPPNAFSDEAKAFEEYIKKAMGVEKSGPLTESECKYKTAEFTDINTGEKYVIDNAFDFEYKPEWKTDEEFANPTTMYDQTTETFTIGPFAIHYEGGTEQFGSREEVQFAGIEDMELYTDASDEPLVFGEDWEIVYPETVRSDDAESKFPKSDEEFYIKLNYIENATQITNIKTKFKYMNAAGMYQKLQGTYFIATWKQQYKDYFDFNGDYDSSTYWLELVSLDEYESQKLALGLNGSRWYEYTEIDRSIGIKSKSLKIEKQVVDGEGNEIDVDAFFDFKVTVNGGQNAGTDKIRVKANKSVTTQTYYWMDGEEAPTYEVEEIPTEGYELVSIENNSGSLDNPESIVIKAVNKVTEEHTGKLQIVKKIQNTSLKDDKLSLVGQTFRFKVIVSGTFKYEGQLYEDSSIELNPEVIAVRENEEGTPWVSGDFTWLGDEAPSYEVEEIEHPKHARIVSITPPSGVLVDDETVEVVALNKAKETGASIRIIKKLENSEKLSEEEIKDLKFYFTLHVDGYDDVEVITTPSRIEENGNYIWVWEYTSSEYVWLEGNEPEYYIEEHDNPEGTTFKEASSEDAQNVSVSGSRISGTLVADKEKEFIVTNNFVNTASLRESKKGRIELTKIVDSDKLIDRDYIFAVTVTGNFRFEGEAEELAEKTRTIQFKNDGYIEIKEDKYDDNTNVTIHVDASKTATWSSDSIGLGQIEWYGNDAPTYKVEERLTGTYGDGVKAAEITPSTGALTNMDSAVVKVTAKNYASDEKEYENGTLRIIKTLENAEKYDANYINSLVFKFKVTVADKEPFTVELKANRVDDKFVWEYVSDKYFWEKGSEAPNYTIEEIDLPKGTEFVSAKGPDGSSSSGTTVSGKLTPSKNDDVLISTDNSFVNKLKDENEGKIVIKKNVTHEVLNGKEFKFRLTLKGTFTYGGEEIVNGEKVIEDISVKAGESWSSESIKWWGENAPTYTVDEKGTPTYEESEESEDNIAKNVTMVNSAGTVTAKTETVVTAINSAIEESGRIKIHKVIKDQPANETDKFTFKITVGDNKPYYVAIKADETYVSQSYTWYKGQEAPTYKVEEVNLPSGTKQVDISNAEGTLNKDEDITIEATNQYEEHRGRFKLRKAIIEDKAVEKDEATFNFNMTVTGLFTVGGQETTTSEIWTEQTSITGEGTYESPEFIWYGNKAPVVYVEELGMGEDGAGWKLEGISNNNAAISEQDVIELVATNRYEPLVIIDLTMQLGGTVWNDVPQTNDKNMEGSTANGKLDNGEAGIDGIEVYVYDNEGNLATIYEDSSKNELKQPIITANGGKWSAPKVKVLRNGSYDVKFVYDGQTYEPTTPLVSGSAESYKSASNSGRSAWFNDSMAADSNRDEVNARLTEIKGNTAMNGSGETVGTAVPGVEGSSNIFYERSSSEGQKRTSSKVITLNSNGTVKDLYKAEARTSQVGLTYPFDQRLHLESFDIQKSELGPEYRYVYSATYPYTLHINLGLVNREIVDVDAIKDLVDAKVVVNKKLLTYKFNKLADVGKDVLSRSSYLDGTDGNNNIKYQVGLYKTDYFYRAEIYKTSKVYDAMDSFYRSITGESIDTTNLEVYLRYRISVYNESPSYMVEINELNDYFDSSFGSPIVEEVKKYVQSVDGKGEGTLETVAKASYIDGTGASVAWNVTEEGIEGSDGVTYNKMSTNSLKGIKLASGEKAEIYVYFKVQPTSVSGINNIIELGNKSNLVEISNYSSYYSDGRIAGRIDVDSAPDNINIREYNEKAYYEDDTDSAPVLNIELDTENGIRTLKGLAWEDKLEDSDENKAIGNGLYDEGKEALIGGLTTELIEKVPVQTAEGNQEYEFLWPTNLPLSALGGRTVESLTGFDSTTETAREAMGDEKSVGEYKFTGIPAGNYFVRFLYGNNKAELDDTFGITGDAVALKPDGNRFSEYDQILVANYKGSVPGTTTAIYNGQDYKASIFQVNNSETKTDWHNLNQYAEYNRDSDFADSEARRVDIIAKDQVITNKNGRTLATANVYSTIADNNPDNYIQDSNHAELYKEYYMFADAGKINFNIENLDSSAVSHEVETVETQDGNSSVRVITNQRNEAYEISDINIGLIERPETRLVLDKEISNIKLTTNDNRVIFDAKYNIDYKIVKALNTDGLKDKVVIADLGRNLINHSYLVAEVTLSEVNSIGTDVMQAINKWENKVTSDDRFGEGTQNFRYINVDDTIMQGTTIQIDYKLTALNISDKDTIGASLVEAINNGTVEEVITELENASRNGTVELGKYVGQEYYTGTQGANDVPVTTRVRQVVDYVDGDGTFTANYNNTENHSWRNTTVNELLGDGYDANRLIGKSIAAEQTIYDKSGIEYMTSQRNNLILSIDNYELTDTALNNSGFEKVLQPLDVNRADEEGYDEFKSQIDLTITKTVAADGDSDNLAFDNIAEIVKFENTAGRRDEASIPGNANTNPDLKPEDEKTVFAEALVERGQSATELVTFTPPTGLEVQTGMTIQILLISVIALGIVVVGIVIIKKKVLD